MPLCSILIDIPLLYIVDNYTAFIIRFYSGIGIQGAVRMHTVGLVGHSYIERVAEDTAVVVGVEMLHVLAVGSHSDCTVVVDVDVLAVSYNMPVVAVVDTAAVGELMLPGGF